jgi:hypothetical protein
MGADVPLAGQRGEVRRRVRKPNFRFCTRTRTARFSGTHANEFIGEVHDRMPVVLEPDQFDPWLSGEAGVELSGCGASACSSTSSRTSRTRSAGWSDGGNVRIGTRMAKGKPERLRSDSA